MRSGPPHGDDALDLVNGFQSGDTVMKYGFRLADIRKDFAGHEAECLVYNIELSLAGARAIARLFGAEYFCGGHF